MTLQDDVIPAAESLRNRLGPWQPELALVLGSGLATLTDELTDARCIDFSELPNFPPSGVTGHSGKIWFGSLYDHKVVIFQGRYHYYEGYSAYQVTAPVRLAHELGCKRILLTNAVGGIDARFRPGHFMLVSDHINLVGENPLRGLKPAPFVDLTNLYRHDFYDSLRDTLQGTELSLHCGTLAWMSGPSYETPAEIRMLESLGADAVTMSTVPEAIMARALGLEIVALSLITNAAAGKSEEELSHDDVLAQGRNIAVSLPKMISRLLSCWNAEH